MPNSLLPSRPGPLPEHTGKIPNPELIALSAAANIAYVAVYAHFHPQSSGWIVALLILAAAGFPYAFLRTFHLHRRNEVARLLWNDMEDTVFEVISRAISSYCRDCKVNGVPPGLTKLEAQWKLGMGEIQFEIDQFSASARCLLRRDMDRMPFIDALWAEGTRDDLACSDGQCADRVYLSLHRRYTQRVRPDLILVLIALAGANAFLMGMMW